MSLDSLFRDILSVPSKAGQILAEALLWSHYGSAVVVGEHYVYAPGTIPLCLVAHTDTVWDDPPEVCYDPERRIVWGTDGLGADDRAGVYAIAALLRDTPHRPHVLLTDGEERGGIGAHSAARTLPCPAVRLLVQLDRANSRDAVYYSHDPSRRLRRYVRRHGDYRTAQGSYTDIATLMPAWGIGGVNLSVGYYGQHGAGEHVRMAELEHTIRSVAAMCAAPPDRLFPYRRKVERPWTDWRIGDDAHTLSLLECWEMDRERSRDDDIRCAYCVDDAVDADEWGYPCCREHLDWSGTPRRG